MTVSPPARRSWRLTPSLPLAQAHGRHHQITPATAMEPGRLVVSQPAADVLVLSPLEFVPPPPSVPSDAASGGGAAAAPPPPPPEWCELHFGQGALLRDDGRGAERSAAPLGLWVVQRAQAPMPRVVCPGGFNASWPVRQG